MAKQLLLRFPKRGGKRRDAGRPRLHQRPGLIGKEVPHLKRAAFATRKPVHVTQRVRPDVGYLRKDGPAGVLLKAFADAEDRGGMRIVHYSIQGSHLHLIVEADDTFALPRGRRGLAARIAGRLNARLRRTGAVFADRYHSHVVSSRRELANAIRYVI